MLLISHIIVALSIVFSVAVILFIFRDRIKKGYFMTRRRKFDKWLHDKKTEAIQNGAETFMGIPEDWLDNARWCCSKGHINSYYIKTEGYGDVCPECYETTRLLPKGHESEYIKKFGTK